MAVPIVERFKVFVEKEVGKAPFQQVVFPTSFCAEETKEWTFHTDFLDKQKPEFFKCLVPHHITWTMELAVFRARLAQDLVELDKGTLSKEKEAELVRKLLAALAISGTFTKYYRSYQDVPREENRLLAEQREYRDVLAARWGYKFTALDLSRKVTVNQGFASSQTTRALHRDLNPLRLMILRLRRLSLLLLVVLNNVEQYGHWVSAIEQFAAPTFAYVAWIFFMPRLVVNLALTCKHVIAHPWMSAEEEALGWQTRLQGQLERRWPELTNDLAWFVSGVLAFCVFTGPMLPFSIYLAVGMQTYDFILASIRTYLELTRFQALEQDYLKLCKDASPEQKQAIQGHLKDLRARMDLERKALYLSLMNFGVLLLGLSMSLPFIAAFSPVIPIVGACLAVLITVVNYVGTQQLDQQRQQKYVGVKLPISPKAKPVPNAQLSNLKLFGERGNKDKVNPSPASENPEPHPATKSRYSMNKRLDAKMSRGASQTGLGESSITLAKN